MNRRLFLQSMNILFYSLLVSLRSKASSVTTSWIPTGRRIPAMQGYTDNTTTQIILLVEQNEKLTYIVTDDAGLSIAIDSIQTSSYPNSRFRLDHLSLSKLSKDVTYQLTTKNSKGEIIDERMFKTLDTATSSAKIGLMSCMDDRVSNHAEMWSSVIEKQPDMLFFLGDNVYVDADDVQVSSDTIWERHVETRLALNIFQVQMLIPILAIWDDHDYAMDDGDSRFPYKEASLKTFKAFFGSHDGKNYSNGPANASYFTAFKQRFVLLDSRYYREKGNRIKNKMWGSVQMSWVKDKLDLKSKEPVWLLNGSQFYGGYQPYESVEREAVGELDEMMSVARSLSAPTVLVSGDVHYSEISSIDRTILGYDSIELTSSAIHSTVADQINDNPRRRFAIRKNSYMVVETSASDNKLDLTINIYGSNQTYHTCRCMIVK